MKILNWLTRAVIGAMLSAALLAAPIAQAQYEVSRAPSMQKQTPLFILATGQSNNLVQQPLAWKPNPNARIWNNIVGTKGSVGTAFVALNPAHIGRVAKLASDMADKMPGRQVYVLNVSFGAQPIAQWLPGASTAGALADVYHEIVDLNIMPAMAAAGVSQVGLAQWGQGETDEANTGYVASFATVMARLRTNSWFPHEARVLIYGIGPTSITGRANSDLQNIRLMACASADPGNRRFVNTKSLSSPAYWLDNVAHMTAAGYFAAGAMGADEAMNGLGAAPPG